MSMKYAIVRILDDNPQPLRAFFGRYVDHRIAAGSATETIKNIRRITGSFLKFIGDVNLADVTTERGDAWRLLLVRRYKPNYARLNLCTVKAALEYAVSIGLVDKNQFQNIELPKTTCAGRVLPDAVLRLFIRALPGEVQRGAKLALYTGMRRSEVVNLEWADITNDAIVIPKHKSKNRRERIIYLSNAARRILGKRAAGRVFDLSLSRLNTAVTATYRRLGIGRVRFHDLRHMAATRHYEKNLDDHSLMETFGWSNPSSAQPYHHVSSERARAAMAKMTYSI